MRVTPNGRRLVFVVVIALVVLASGCVGGRIGYRVDTKHKVQTGIYGGPQFQILVPLPARGLNGVAWLAGLDWFRMYGPGPNQSAFGPAFGVFAGEYRAAIGYTMLGVQYGGGKKATFHWSICGGPSFGDDLFAQITLCGRGNREGTIGADLGVVVSPPNFLPN